LDHAQWQELLRDPNHPLQNRSIQSTYSPGSIFKIVVALAGLGEGEVDPAETVRCTGSTKIYDRRFRCWKRSGHGRVNLHEAIKQSCDVYFYYLGQRLGIERIAQYARTFGLGQKVNLDIEGEKAGLIPDMKWKLRARGEPWYPGETISVAIGQGPVLVTPLQLATMMSTIANGGYRVTPHGLMDAREIEQQPIDVKPAHLAAVKRALWSVVNENGTGASAFVEGLDVVGKTGTVQVIEQKTWIDSEDLPFEKRDHAWFVSFATLGDRQLAVAVFVEHGGAGSLVAAPLAKNLYQIYFRDQLAHIES
jgi:penicillin-binding protein 2